MQQDTTLGTGLWERSSIGKEALAQIILVLTCLLMQQAKDNKLEGEKPCLDAQESHMFPCS